jgi:hypothetical protein
MTYRVGAGIDAFGRGTQNAGGVVVLAGGEVGLATWFTGVGAGAGGAIAGLGGVVYTGGTTITEVGNMVKFFGGQSAGLTAVNMLPAPSMLVRKSPRSDRRRQEIGLPRWTVSEGSMRLIDKIRSGAYVVQIGIAKFTAVLILALGAVSPIFRDDAAAIYLSVGCVTVLSVLSLVTVFGFFPTSRRSRLSGKR